MRLTICRLLRATLIVSLAVAAGPIQARAKDLLTNAQIIELTKLGLSEPTIIEKIRHSGHDFDTSVEALRRLKEAQVSDAVIREMINPQEVGRNQQHLLYRADWMDGLNGWIGASDWKAGYGMLMNDGSGPHYWRMSIAAPFHPVTNNYAIEAEIRVLGVKGCSSFGFVGRAVAGFGEQMGINFCECHCAGLWDRDDVPKYYFDPGWSWHTYRLELNGTLIKFSIDNKEVITAADDRFISPGSIGLWCDQMAIHVRTFAVYALSDK